MGTNHSDDFPVSFPGTSLPKSAVHCLVAAAGLLAFLAAAAAVRLARPFGNDVVHSALFIILVTSATIFLLDLGWQKVHLRPSAGLDFNRDDPSWSRTLLKFLGLLGCLAFVGLGYWLFPIYHGEFFDNYYALLRLVLPPWIALAIPYILWIDRKMQQPLDGYWHLGRLLTLQWERVDSAAIGQLLLGWLIKGFFLAIMFSYMCKHIYELLLFDFSTLTSFRKNYDFLYNFLYFIDVGLVSMGYLMSLRLTDTHIRSAEPTMLGWMVALICYDPFWQIVHKQYVNYSTGYPWSAWLANWPTLYAIWGSAILALLAIYVWATVIFGARFSNLTHRGIITNGPYRWTKHPAYIAKNLSWWMIAVPFLPRSTPDEALRNCLLLLLVNLIYFLRAKTEERHLLRDPDYVCYALWMEEHGIFRFLRRLPLIRHLTHLRLPVDVPVPVKSPAG